MQELLAQAAGGGMFSCGFCEFKTYCSKVDSITSSSSSSSSSWTFSETCGPCAVDPWVWGKEVGLPGMRLQHSDKVSLTSDQWPLSFNIWPRMFPMDHTSSPGRRWVSTWKSTRGTSSSATLTGKPKQVDPNKSLADKYILNFLKLWCLSSQVQLFHLWPRTEFTPCGATQGRREKQVGPFSK